MFIDQLIVDEIILCSCQGPIILNPYYWLAATYWSANGCFQETAAALKCVYALRTRARLTIWVANEFEIDVLQWEIKLTVLTRFR